jgi:hypothetical protein
MADEAQYSQIIAHAFAKRYKRGAREVVFDREEIVDAAQKLGLPRPKNIGDVVYSFRFRKAFPDSIKKTAPKGLEWILRKAGASRYRFVLGKQWSVAPDPHRSIICNGVSRAGPVRQSARTSQLRPALHLAP